MRDKARVECARAVFAARKSRECDGRYCAAPGLPERTHSPEKHEPIDVRHADVADEHVGLFAFDELQCRHRGPRGKHFRIAFRKHAFDQFACVRLSVDDQDFNPGEIETVPPCISTSVLTMERPRPSPLWVRVVDASACRNRSNT